jgi:two-component system phosphate regulon sensor histidine kinase PhoR
LTEQIRAEISEFIGVILVAAILACVLAFILARFQAENLLRPIRKLIEVVNDEKLNTLEPDLIAFDQEGIQQLASGVEMSKRRFGTRISDLEHEQRKLDAVLLHLADGIVIVEKSGTIQLINPAAEKMFEFDPNPQPRSTLAQLTRHHQIIDLWKQTRDSLRTRTASIDFLNKRLSLDVIAIPLTDHMPGSTLLVFRDVTHVRRLETIRRDFISNVSHELRTPLASLKALTETLQDGALDDPQMARHFLTRMETEVDSMSLMVQELLELSRIESGKFPLNLISITPNEIIKSAVDRLSLQAERNGLSLQLSLPDGTLPEITADPARLEQVIVNLIHNAIKFTPGGGEIQVSAWQDGDSVVVSIKDTGIGISDFDLPRIFERFFKADRARAGGGTGLGLAIAKHMVEAHFGKIWVESQEGIGSNFYFSIPRSR